MARVATFRADEGGIKQAPCQSLESRGMIASSIGPQVLCGGSCGIASLGHTWRANGIVTRCPPRMVRTTDAFRGRGVARSAPAHQDYAHVHDVGTREPRPQQVAGR